MSMSSLSHLPFHPFPASLLSRQHSFLPYKRRTHSLLPVLPELHIPSPGKYSYVLASSSSHFLSASQEQILEAVTESDGKTLPCVRIYENDLARLTLVGAVDFEHALTAAAADGGRAAREHIESGISAMVIETVYPGSSGEHATISTRLFLPAREVKVRAKKLKCILDDDILPGTSRNILAMTFRQVVLQQLWSFELALFSPGSERNMADLENPREVSASFTLSSSDGRVISALAEVLCISALESTERYFMEKSVGSTPHNFLHWFRRPKKTISKDTSVILYKFFEDEIVQNFRSLLEKFKRKRAGNTPRGQKQKYNWWTPSAYSRLEKVGGPQFSAWTSEHVPAYKLQIDANVVKNIKFDGWKSSADHRWELLLTHSQMVELSSILDLYYEDVYSLPGKMLSCGVVGNFTDLLKRKRNFSLVKMLSFIFASAGFLVSVGILGCLLSPHLLNGRKFTGNHFSSPLYGISSTFSQSLEASQLEASCFSIIERIKDAFGWPGDVLSERGVGAWTGESPIFQQSVSVDKSSDMVYIIDGASEKSNASITASSQDVATYQVALSPDGKVIGFQPTSRTGVNHWAANPLAKELYDGKKLSPGLIEPGLKMDKKADEIILAELLISVNPDVPFAWARPLR